jgi:hypothetical protein
MSIMDSFGLDQTSFEVEATGDARDILTNALKKFFGASAEDAALIASLGTFVDQQLLSGRSIEEINLNIRQTDAWKKRFAGNELLRQAGFAEFTPSEYLMMEKSYSQILANTGMGDLARRETFTSLIGGNVSVAELQDRVNLAYERVLNADDQLSQELQKLREFGGLSNADIAKSLLMGKDGAAVLQRKIAAAEISSEASRRGLTSSIDPNELVTLGVSRREAAQGFEAVAQATPALQQLANIYGSQTEGLQQELEKEQFTGLQSERRKKLSRKEIASFAGQSGTASVSLQRNRAGSL